MGDEGFDPCECMWSHELAMRRLLSLLRQNQAHCTDTECLNEVPGMFGGTQSGGGDNSFIMMMMCWMVVALVLYLLRPSSMRDRGISDSKPSGGPEQDSQGPPPSPPAIQ